MLEYYINFRPYADTVLSGLFGEIDINNIPKIKRRDKLGEYMYHPTNISQFALGNYQYYYDDVNRNIKNYRYFEASARWLVNNLNENEGKYYWYFNYDVPTIGLISPWYSGMTQGLGISILVRYYELIKDDEILKMALDAFKVLNLNISDGGACFIDGDDYWIEEYPSSLKHIHVLNGFIYGVYGLMDLYNISKNIEVEKLLHRCLSTLERNIKYYDVNNWSIYDLKSRLPASLHYQKLHINQLHHLYESYKIESFNEYEKKWTKYLSNPMFIMNSQSKLLYNQIKIYFKVLGIKKGLNQGVRALYRQIVKKM
jgi:hypothetical protein